MLRFSVHLHHLPQQRRARGNYDEVTIKCAGVGAEHNQSEITACAHFWVSCVLRACDPLISFLLTIADRFPSTPRFGGFMRRSRTSGAITGPDGAAFFSLPMTRLPN